MPLLVKFSIAVKRNHDQDNSYKEHLIGSSLQFQRLSPLSSRQEAWQHPGRHGARGAESSTSSFKGRQGQNVLRQPGGGSQSLPPQWHTFSNKATVIPTRPYLLIVPLPGSSIFKPPHPSPLPLSLLWMVPGYVTEGLIQSVGVREQSLSMCGKKIQSLHVWTCLCTSEQCSSA